MGPTPSLNLDNFKYATICLRVCNDCVGWTRHEQYVGEFNFDGCVLYKCVECGLKSMFDVAR